MEKTSRTDLLIGKEKSSLIKSLKIAVFGVGGVGGFAVEALVRSGVENIAVFLSRLQFIMSIPVCGGYFHTITDHHPLQRFAIGDNAAGYVLRL